MLGLLIFLLMYSTLLHFQAVSVIELYGVLNPETRDWYDGLLSNIFRAVNKPLDPGSKERKYILFDGDVDALWIENMNSVMDDNKILTLANGERIRLLAHCQLLFEVSYDNNIACSGGGRRVSRVLYARLCIRLGCALPGGLREVVHAVALRAPRAS